MDGKQRERQDRSRLQVARDLGKPIDFPDIGSFSHLLDDMVRLGPIRLMGEGTRATDWPEIIAFAHGTGRLLTVWERETMADMCLAYWSNHQRTDPLARSPLEIERRRVIASGT